MLFIDEYFRISTHIYHKPAGGHNFVSGPKKQRFLLRNFGGRISVDIFHLKKAFLGYLDIGEHSGMVKKIPKKSRNFGPTDGTVGAKGLIRPF